MSRLILLLATAFVLGGCVIESDSGPSHSAVETCNKLDAFLGDCYVGCGAIGSCEANFDSYSFADQDDLWECADCLDGVRCGEDCTLGGIGSCLDFLEDLLGSNCW